MEKAVDGTHFKADSSVSDMLNLSCQLEIQVELLGRQLNMCVSLKFVKEVWIRDKIWN
jgi:hypothetical protein